MPDVPHAQLVQEVHRIVLQSQADAKFYDNTYGQINDHADKLEKLKDIVRKQIARMDQSAADMGKVAEDVVRNDMLMKLTLEENDAATKKILANNDGELKRKH